MSHSWPRTFPCTSSAARMSPPSSTPSARSTRAAASRRSCEKTPSFPRKRESRLDPRFRGGDDAHMNIDGVEVFVEGNGTDTIVMVHGWPDTYRLWDQTVEHLKSRYRCVRFTVPGFDRAHERRRRSLADLSAFIDAVVQKVSPDRKVILMLHDWGCVFGYRYYMDHPERVARIVGVDVGDLVSLEPALSLPAKLGV